MNWTMALYGLAAVISAVMLVFCIVGVVCAWLDEDRERGT